MQKWEYLRLTVSFTVRGRVENAKVNGEEIFDITKNDKNTEFILADYLMKLGGDGWEMVNAFSWGDGWTEAYYFKRPIE